MQVTHEHLLPDYGDAFRRMLDSAKLKPHHAAHVWAKYGVTQDHIDEVLAGTQYPNEGLFKALDAHAPLYKGDLYIPEVRDSIPLIDNAIDGVVVKSAKESDQTRRELYRKQDPEQSDAQFHIYDYADTAVSRRSKTTILPERIWEYHVVPQGSESDLFPGAMNNGHFEQQMTYFVGPVTIHWKDAQGNIHFEHMNTGDMEYHTSMVPHMFTKRTPDQEGLILATTYRGELGDRRFLEQVRQLSDDEFINLLERRVGTLEDHLGFESAGQIVQKKHESQMRKSGDYVVRHALQNIPYQRKTRAMEFTFDNIPTSSSPDTVSQGERWGYVLEGPVNLRWSDRLETLNPNDSFFIHSNVAHSLRPYEGNKGKVIVMEVTPEFEDPWTTAAIAYKYAGKDQVMRIKHHNMSWSS